MVHVVKTVLSEERQRKGGREREWYSTITAANTGANTKHNNATHLVILNACCVLIHVVLMVL